MQRSKSSERAFLKPRLSSLLNQRLDQKLLGYAAAAGAAGVGVMALAQPSAAEIVYTPTHQDIKIRGRLAVDLNNDGITDFTIYNNFSSCGSQPPSRLGAVPPECSEHTIQDLDISPAAGNGVVKVAISSSFAFASALEAFRIVGPSAKFAGGAWLQRCATSEGRGPYSSGQWRNVKNRFLGLQFSVNGETYYGWARLTVTVKTVQPGLCTTAAVLTGYAYESEPGKPIPAGKTSGKDEIGEVVHPATLGMLAAGSARIDARRREEDSPDQRDR